MSWGLTMANIPGTEYVMPSGIGGLGVPMPGVGYNMGGLGSLYIEPVGVGDGGGTPYHPMGKVDTDAEDYICIHLPVSPTSDDTHANLLYKEIMVFNHREPPMPGTNNEITVLVPINWLNIWLDKMYKIGFLKFEKHAKSFMTRYQSHFSDLFQEELTNSVDVGNRKKKLGHVNNFRMTMGSGSGSMAFTYGGSGSGGGGGTPSSYSSSFSSSGYIVGGQQQINRYSDDDLEETQQLDRKSLMNEFVKYLSFAMPPTDFIFTDDVTPSWLSDKFPSPQAEDVDVWLDTILTMTLEEKKGLQATGGSKSPNNTNMFTGTDQAEHEHMEDLEDKLNLQHELKTQEALVKKQTNSGAKSSITSSSMITAPSRQNVLKENDLEKFVRAAKKQREEQKLMKEEMLEFFQSAAAEPYHIQFTNDPNGVEYLFRGGFFKNWAWTGVVNTMMDDTSAKHAFGTPFASYPLAKVVVERETITYNIWGGELLQGTQLYMKLERTPLSSIILGSLSNFAGDNRGLDNSTLLTDENALYLNKIKTIDNQYEPAWKNYGSYRLVPYQNGRSPPNTADLHYINIFGIKESAILIPVGTVKYDTMTYDYNYATRNLALGLVNPETKLPPSLEASKAAMISLPKITVLLRTCL